MNDFEIELKERTEYVQKIIYRYCPKEEGQQQIITKAINYSLKAGGKRLRPLLMLQTLKMFSKDEELVYPFMAAMEMIHTYSLVHDDLPAMDNDLYRRGKKTTHAVYGEDIAILAGDGLLNLAYEIMANAVVTSSNPVASAKAMQVISQKAGIYGMIGGQTVDVINDGKAKSLGTINFINELKTSALIEASMMAGGVLAGISNDEISTIEKIASNVGIAFQIQDDILDVTSTMDVLGKPVLSDERNHKDTYVSLMGIEESRRQVKKYSNEAIALLESFKQDNEFLKKLIIKLIHREK